MINPILSLIQGKQLIQDHYGNMVEIDEWSHDIARNWPKTRASGGLGFAMLTSRPDPHRIPNAR